MRFLAGSPKLAPPIDPIMSEGSTSRGSGVKAIIADLQQKIAESDGECARVDRGWSGRSGASGGRLPPSLPSRGLAACRELLRKPVFSRFLSPGAHSERASAPCQPPSFAAAAFPAYLTLQRSAC